MVPRDNRILMRSANGYSIRLFTSKPWVQGVDGRRRREGAGKWLGLHVSAREPLPSAYTSV
jgi:hypothetical protein